MDDFENYTILTHNDPTVLSAKVRELKAKGWIVSGGIAVSAIDMYYAIYAQAMILPKPNEA